MAVRLSDDYSKTMKINCDILYLRTLGINFAETREVMILVRFYRTRNIKFNIPLLGRNRIPRQRE